MAESSQRETVKLTKELKGLMTDTGKLSAEVRNLAKENKDLLGSSISKVQILLKHQMKQAKANKLSTVEAQKYYEKILKINERSKDMVSIQESYNESYKSQKRTMQDINVSTAGFLGKLTAMITPLNIILALAVWLGKVFYDWTKRGEEFRITTGIVGDQFNKLNTQAMRVAAELGHLGVSQKEALEYTQALVEEFGSIDMISKELVTNTAIISVTMGMSADEATKLMSSFMTITAGSEVMASNMIGFVSSLSESAGVARNMVMKDIAENASDLAGYMKEGGKNIVVAAVQARQLGVSISTVVGAADKLLEFESSIEAQMNAMLLTGRQVNTERARGLALSGDLAGMQREILSQVGSQAEFERMNVIQRRALAEAFGMNAGELGKMISRQKILKDLTDGQITAAQAMAKGMSLSDVLGTNKQVMSGLTQLTNSLVKLGNFVATFLVPTFTVLAGLLGYIAEAMNWVFDGISSIVPETEDAADGNEHWIETGVKFVATAVLMVGVIKLLKLAMGALSKPTGQMDMFGGAAKKGGGIFGRLFGGMSWSAIAKGAAILVILGGSLWIVGKALQQFTDIEWKDLAIAGVAIIGLVVAMAALGALMGSGIGAVAIMLGVVAFAAMGVALNILGEGISKMGTGFTFISTSLKTIASLSIPDFSSWDGLIDRVALLSTFAEPLANVADSITALSTFAEPLANVADSVTAISTVVPAGAGVGMAENDIMAGGVPSRVVERGDVNISLDDVVKKLDEIEDIFRDGIDLKLNGAKIGEWLSKEARKA